MCGILEDGTGKGYKAKVTSDNRLAVNSVNESVRDFSIVTGDGYNIATSRVTLTSSSESALIYIKNQEDVDLIINSVFVNTVDGAGTLSGQPVLRVYRNPLGGTIVSTATPVTNKSNQNFGSNKVLTADIYEGFETATFINQTNIIDVPLPSRLALTFTEFETRVVLPKGSSYGISYQPETGTTTLDVITGVTLFKLPESFS